MELRVSSGNAGTRLRLVPRPGWRINALLPPALETSNGMTIRFVSESLSADSSYYRVPPEATLPGGAAMLRGTLRASVCAAGEQICRPYVLRLGS